MYSDSSRVGNGRNDTKNSRRRLSRSDPAAEGYRLVSTSSAHGFLFQHHAEFAADVNAFLTEAS